MGEVIEFRPKGIKVWVLWEANRGDVRAVYTNRDQAEADCLRRRRKAKRWIVREQTAPRWTVEHLLDNAKPLAASGIPDPAA